MTKPAMVAPGCALVRYRRLFRIPLQETDLDASALQRFLEDGKIGAAVVVGDHDLRMKSFDGVGGFIGRHGVGKVHTDEGDVDVLEGTHFGDAFGIAGEVEALAAVGEDVSVAAAFVVEKFSG